MQHSCKFVQTELFFTRLRGWLLDVLALQGSGREVSGEPAGGGAVLCLARCPGLRGQSGARPPAHRPENGARRHSPPDLCPGVWAPAGTWRPHRGRPGPARETPRPPARPRTARAHLGGPAPPSCVSSRLEALRPPSQQLLLSARLWRVFTVLAAAGRLHHSCLHAGDLWSPVACHGWGRPGPGRARRRASPTNVLL